MSLVTDPTKLRDNVDDYAIIQQVAHLQTTTTWISDHIILFRNEHNRECVILKLTSLMD